MFPVISGLAGTGPVFAGLGDYDLDLLDSRVLDGSTLAVTYRPTARFG